jgi:hypothetical protein
MSEIRQSMEKQTVSEQAPFVSPDDGCVSFIRVSFVRRGGSDSAV